MSRHSMIAILLTTLLAMGSWTFAQQSRPGEKIALEDGPFAIASTGESAVLLDSSSGRTWVLTHSALGEPVWLPAGRLNSNEEAHDWREREELAKQHLAARKRAEMD